MLLLKLIVVSFCCIISLQHFSQCAVEQRESTTEKDTAQAMQSNIYTIRKLDTTTKDDFRKQLKPQQKLQIKLQQQLLQEQKQRQMQKQKQKTVAMANISDDSTKPPRTKKFNSVTKNSHSMNKKLLNKLGFTKVKAPNSHNRKRLAIESRRYVSPDDSHMFIIKLPPNLYYYSNPKEAGITANDRNALVQQTQTKIETQPTMLNANGKKVSFPFSSNGKPGRIYHWNLPVIKKILDDKQRFPSVAAATKDQLIDIKDIPTWNKPWENETIEKSYGKSSMMNYKKSLKRKSPSYYAPANAVNKNSFNKYFAGNGKPRGFYVIKENHKKPLFYKNIVS